MSGRNWMSVKAASTLLGVSEAAVSRSLADQHDRAAEWGAAGEGWRIKPLSERGDYQLRRSWVERMRDSDSKQFCARLSRRNSSRWELTLARHLGGRVDFRRDAKVYFDRRMHCVPDATVQSAKVAVFLDGCFWHECPEHYPDALGGAVQARDARNNRLLRERGWLVLRLWEHDYADLPEFANQVVAVVGQRMSADLAS